MDSGKKEAFITYLDSRTSSTQENTLRLIEDDRKDEADFEKIRTNIFQIIKTMFQASDKMAKEESELAQCMESRFLSLEEPWKASLMKAKEHNDDVKVLKEQAKLEILSEIQDTFRKIWR